MIKSYTLAEMEELWRRRLGLLENDCGCVVTRHDGTALNALIADRIRAWYAHLLRTADVSLLPVRDLAADVETVRLASANCLELELPPQGVRPLLVKLTDWPEPTATFAAPGSDAAALQSSRYLCATPSRPVAVLCGRMLRLHGLTSAPGYGEAAYAPDLQLRRRVEQLLMVAEPDEPDTFILDTSLLLTIPADI